MVVYRRMPMNPVLCAAIFCGIGGGAALGINFFSGSSAAASVGLTAVLTGCMHGVNLMLISMLPPFFQKHGNISFISGLLNSFVYIGSAISTYGIALISERNGWGMTVFLWMLIAVAGTLICTGCLPAWRKFTKE
jgi:OPA family glycerol-3-phosphate transporter-like MFS transporter